MYWKNEVKYFSLCDLLRQPVWLQEPHGFLPSAPWYWQQQLCFHAHSMPTWLAQAVSPDVKVCAVNLRNYLRLPDRSQGIGFWQIFGRREWPKPSRIAGSQIPFWGQCPYWLLKFMCLWWTNVSWSVRWSARIQSGLLPMASLVDPGNIQQFFDGRSLRGASPRGQFAFICGCNFDLKRMDLINLIHVLCWFFSGRWSKVT